MTAFLQIQDLEIIIPANGQIIEPVRGISLTINEGETVGLVGESGSGKSMTAMSIVGLLPPAAEIANGTISLGGQQIHTASQKELRRVRREDVGVVFQSPMKALNPRMMVGTQLREALRGDERRTLAAAYDRSIELLRSVGINRPAERIRQYPHELSGGLAQRVVIALALARHPRLLIADEPTTALDVSVQAQILDLLDHLRSELNIGVLLVSHDLDVIRDRADRTYVMHLGKIVESGATLDVIDHPQHSYTKGLIAAMPSLSRGRGITLVGLGKQPASPDPADLDPGDSGAPQPTVDPDVLINSAVLDHPAVLDSPATQPSNDGRSPALVEAQDVRRSFKSNGFRLPWQPKPTIAAVDGITLDVRPGESLGIVGESGSGKTTLARMLVGLDRPDSGHVLFNGKRVDRFNAAERKAWHEDVQFVFQDSTSALDPRRTVADSIEEPMLAAGISAAQRRKKMISLLHEVGLTEEYADRKPRQLSGGQRQRIGIARALALDPKLIIADEPVSALDVSVQATVLNLLNTLRQQRGVAYVVISHDLGVINYICTKVAVMFKGRVVDSGPVEQVLENPTDDYTKMLLAAVPGRNR